MSEEIPKFDRDRAAAILGAAKKHNMYPDPLPESDEALIMEAEKMVTLAKQAEKVASAAGQTNVPHYEAIMAVIFEADVTGGSEPVEDSEPGDPGLPEGNGEDPEFDPEPEPEEEPESDEEEIEPDGAEEDPPEDDETDDDPAESELKAKEDPDALSTGDLWGDEDGVVWVIDEDLGEKGIEAHMDGSKERTIMPRDYFVRPVKISKKAPKEIGSSGEPASKKEEPSKASPSPVSEPSAPTASPSESSTPAPEETPSEETSTESSPEPESSPSPSATPSESRQGEVNEEYEGVIKEVDAIYKNSGLPLPVDVQKPPQMPEDLTKTPDIEARKLHSQFNACAGRAHYLLGLERQIKIGCDRLKKKHLKPAMREARNELPKSATITEVKSAAEESEIVQMWFEREAYHADREATYKDLFEIYTKNVEVLSRDWSMREKNQSGS